MDWKPGLYRAQQIFVIVDLQARVQAPLHQDLGAAELRQLLDLLENLLLGKDIPLLRTRQPIEGAERTLDPTDIRVIDIPPDYVCDDRVRVQTPASGVGHGRQLEQGSAFEKFEAFVEAEPFPSLDLLGHRSDPALRLS